MSSISTVIIGGTGFNKLTNFNSIETRFEKTQWGMPSSKLQIGNFDGYTNTKLFGFLARHGEDHSFAPHKINYRANIQTLVDAGFKNIIAINAVGRINTKKNHNICIPHQIIDYTTGRESSFFSEKFSSSAHIDFTHPFNETLRDKLKQSAKIANIDIIDKGVYGCTNGPRLETAAEIIRMEQDGCNIVGMTAMPEAVLAREKEINYASVSLITNIAAGKSDQLITTENIRSNLNQGIKKVHKILPIFFELRDCPL